MTNRNGFNLVDDPWIPLGGTEVSISDALLEGHHLPGWPDGDPVLAAAVMRTLAVFAYRVTGMDQPMSRSDFASRQRSLLDAGRFAAGAVNRYTSRHHDRFWLVGGPANTVPFAQDPSLERTDPHNAATAVTAWASGNNPLLGPHADTNRIDAATAARQLVVLRYYSAGGTRTRHPDRPGSGSAKTKASGLRGTMSLHPHGDSLARTLIGHLMPLPAGVTEFGNPFWEAPPPQDPLASHRGQAGLLEQLAARQDKTMLLRQDKTDGICGFTIADGPGAARDLACLDPYVLVGDDMTPVKPREGRAFWREAEPLLTQADTGRARLGAEILDWARGEQAGAHAIYEPSEFSWAVVSHLGDRSKDLLWQASSAPHLLALFAPDAALRARRFLKEAADAESAMTRQIAKLRHDMSTMPSRDKAEVHGSARAEYWTRAEPDFWAAVRDGLAPEEQTSGLRSHAFAGYDIAVAAMSRDQRALWFVEKSRQWIRAWPPAREG